MRHQSQTCATKPAAQLPKGPYPASAAVIWMVAVLAVLIGLTLAVLIPSALSSGGSGHPPAAVPGSLDSGGRDGDNR